jgi:hypothetical protein
MPTVTVFMAIATLIVIIVVGYVVILLLGLIPGLPPIVPTLVWIAVALICLAYLLQALGGGHIGNLKLP